MADTLSRKSKVDRRAASISGDAPMTSDLQQRLRERLSEMPNQMGSITELAALLRISRLAVYSAARALHRRGMATQWLYAGDGEGCQMVAYRDTPSMQGAPRQKE